MDKNRHSKKADNHQNISGDHSHIDQRSGGVYIQDGRLYVRGNLIGRDYIVVNLPPLTWKTLLIGFGLPLLLIGLVSSGLLLWSGQSARAAHRQKTAQQGWINLAVANFGEQSTPGKMTDSKDGSLLSSIFFAELDDDLFDLQAEISNQSNYVIGLRSPNEISRIDGDTWDEREKNAQAKASEKDIDVILLGYLEYKDGKTIFNPELFISPAKLEQAEELSGLHHFGNQIKTFGQINGSTVNGADMSQRIMGGPKAFAYFLYGLGRFQNFEFDEAKRNFEQALREALRAEKIDPIDDLLKVRTEEVPDPDVFKTFYLFLARTYYETAITSPNREDKMDHWGEARKYYEKALEFDPNYARAKLGIADTIFQLSKDGCQKGDENLNVEGLKDSIQRYEQLSETATSQPELANFPIKLSFYLGRAYYCESRAQIDAQWQSAEKEMCQVVKGYGDGTNEPLRLLASEAYGFLGFIYLDQPARDNAEKLNNLRFAGNQYRQAIRLAKQRDRQCFFYNQLALFSSLIGDARPDEVEWAARNCADVQGKPQIDNFPRDFPKEGSAFEETRGMCSP